MNFLEGGSKDIISSVDDPVIGIGSVYNRVHLHSLITVTHTAKIHLDYDKIREYFKRALGYVIHFDAKPLKDTEINIRNYQKIIDELDDELPEQTEEPPELTDLRDALTLKWPSTVIIAGATDTGKTMLMKNIIYQNALAFNRIYLLSPLADEDVYNFIPKKYRISNPTEADLIQILEEQKKNKHIKTCIICDDCIGKINFANGAISKMITTTGRHYDLSLIIVMQ